jgi:hypothetical protein
MFTIKSLENISIESLYDSVKILNIQAGCESITGFLQSNSITLSGKQYEMIKQL